MRISPAFVQPFLLVCSLVVPETASARCPDFGSLVQDFQKDQVTRMRGLADCTEDELRVGLDSILQPMVDSIERVAARKNEEAVGQWVSCIQEMAFECAKFGDEGPAERCEDFAQYLRGKVVDKNILSRGFAAIGEGDDFQKILSYLRQGVEGSRQQEILVRQARAEETVSSLKALVQQTRAEVADMRSRAEEIQGAVQMTFLAFILLSAILTTVLLLIWKKLSKQPTEPPGRLATDPFQGKVDEQFRQLHQLAREMQDKLQALTRQSDEIDRRIEDVKALIPTVNRAQPGLGVGGQALLGRRLDMIEERMRKLVPPERGPSSPPSPPTGSTEAPTSSGSQGAAGDRGQLDLPGDAVSLPGGERASSPTEREPLDLQRSSLDQEVGSLAREWREFQRANPELVGRLRDFDQKRGIWSEADTLLDAKQAFSSHATLQQSWDMTREPLDEYWNTMSKVKLLDQIAQSDRVHSHVDLDKFGRQLQDAKHFLERLQGENYIGKLMNFSLEGWLSTSFVNFVDEFLRKGQKDRGFRRQYSEIEKIFLRALRGVDLEPIEIEIGKTRFDARIFEGVGYVKDPDIPEGFIAGVSRNGFRDCKKREILRTPKVVVNRR